MISAGRQTSKSQTAKDQSVLWSVSNPCSCFYAIHPMPGGQIALHNAFLLKNTNNHTTRPIKPQRTVFQTAVSSGLFRKSWMQQFVRSKRKLFVLPFQEKMPLAVVGSNVVIEVNGKKVRGRQYPWGVAEGRFTQVHCQKGRTRLPLCGQSAGA